MGSDGVGGADKIGVGDIVILIYIFIEVDYVVMLWSMMHETSINTNPCFAHDEYV